MKSIKQAAIGLSLTVFVVTLIVGGLAVKIFCHQFSRVLCISWLTKLPRPAEA